MKPMEVELLVAEVGADPSSDQLFHILYDGTVMDEDGSTVLGGETEAGAEGHLVAGWALMGAYTAIGCGSSYYVALAAAAAWSRTSGSAMR